MAEVVIRWDIRAAGREVGDVESVEKTEFVEGLINQGRVTVLHGKEAKAALGEHEDDELPELPTIEEVPPAPKKRAHKPIVENVELPEDDAPVTAP